MKDLIKIPDDITPEYHLSLEDQKKLEEKNKKETEEAFASLLKDKE